MMWVLAEPFKSVYVTAEESGLFIRSDAHDLTSELPGLGEPLDSLGHDLPSLIPQLLEQGFAEATNHFIRIPYAKFITLNDEGISTFEYLVPFAPFFIELSTTGILGRDNFKYHVKYYLGFNQIAAPERIGCFVRHLGKTLRLDNQTFSLINQIQQFRNLSPEERTTPECLVQFAKIRGIAESVGAQIDQYIRTNKVLIPPALGLDIIEEQDGRISFAPYIDGVPREDLRRVFLQAEDVADLYIDDGNGGRIRLVFNLEQQEALLRMSRVRHLAGQEKTKVLRNPQAIFDGIGSAIDIEIGDFGPRVKGIGRFPFVSMPVIQRSAEGFFEDPDITSNAKEKDKLRFNAGIRCKYQDGTEETIFFQSKNELLQFNQQVQSAHRGGDGIVHLSERSIVVDQDFARGVAQLVKRVIPGVKSIPDQDETRKYLIIFENDEKLDYEEAWTHGVLDESSLTLPHNLKSEFPLKAHQIEGLRWLQRNYLLDGKRGCLLADDMGLGKTLQILAFVSWLIEKEELTPELNYDPEVAPWNPVLIITPVMLLENETWIQDMKKFFKSNGAVFSPWYVLHGKTLKEMRVPGLRGQENIVQRPLLDLERMREYRMILTNYETIVNYQFSFASMKSDLTLVVTDEAQTQKTPKTKISHALKSLSPRFRIACTGTPVETRLLDVWNIMDYLQPGQILGSASSFSKTYEQPLNNNPEQMPSVLESLRNRLQFGKPTSFILRREKSQALKGLPKKKEHRIMCELSSVQRDYHIEYISRARQGGEGNHPFKLLQALMKLYQHPFLITGYNPTESNCLSRIIEQCPKLSKLLELLDTILHKSEKALIFTRSIDMQQLLANSIFEKFGQRVDIVNGAASRNETGTSSNTRKSMINRFRNDEKLNFVILSPEVAGLGLTLVEANHVIHYGRWWNPAKESQATDRAYRIGQERDVNVYYFIAKDPQDQFKSFDEKLDSLIDRRRQMAMDFLAPMPGEEVLENELYNEIFHDSLPQSGTVKPIGIDEIRLLPWDRFESLIAVLEQKKGHRVILTPRSGDMGIDVISISGDKARLIQCKHKRYEDDLEVGIVAEILNAFDTYRARFFSGKGYNLKPILATNGRITSTILHQCKKHDIDVLWGNSLSALLKTDCCTHADIEFMEATRFKSLNQLADKIEVI